MLKGGWFALEQAGRLVNDAAALFQAGSYSSAAGLALLSREEVAKSRKLFDLWMRAARGELITRDAAIAEIDSMDHVQKQRHGSSSFSIPVDPATLEALLRGRDAAADEYDDAIRRLRAVTDRLLKRAPGARHEQRLRALYVDPADDRCTWVRPGDMTQAEAEGILVDARNDYWQQHRAPGIPALASDMAALNDALAAWHDKPQLPPVEWSTRA